MSKIRYVLIALTVVALAALSGCKAQQQMQQQIADMDQKIADDQKRISALDTDVKKLNFELSQLKGLVTKLGNVTVDLQKAEEERAKAAAAHANHKTGAKKSAKLPAKKKHK